MTETFYRAYRKYENRKTDEIYRWNKEEAKAEIATIANIPQPAWKERYEWSEEERAMGVNGESYVVVTDELIK